MDFERVEDNVAYAMQRISGLEDAMVNAGITSPYGAVTDTFYNIRDDAARANDRISLLEERLSTLEIRLTRDVIREVIDRYKRYEDDKDLTGMTEDEFINSISDLLGGVCY